jgi:hypothetical protein
MKIFVLNLLDAKLCDLKSAPIIMYKCFVVYEASQSRLQI